MTGARARAAVVGAGVAGLTCARALEGEGFEVTTFDKGRAVGGRLTTRRSPTGTFDLGAQYFTARDARFAALVHDAERAGACAPWRGRIVARDDDGLVRDTAPIDRFVGAPDMSALGHHLARGLTVRTSHRVERISRDGEELVLRGEVGEAGVTLGPASRGPGREELGRFDFVVCCLPAPQAALLVDEVSPRLAEHARGVALEPCFALGLAASDEDLPALGGLAFDGAFIGREETPSSSLLSWVARDSSKPGRPPGERWVLHASAAWSRASLDVPQPEVVEAMIAELSRLFGLGRLSPSHTTIQRWSLARAPRPLDGGALVDPFGRVALGGDWASGGRVEGAYVSGLTLAARIRALHAPG